MNQLPETEERIIEDETSAEESAEEDQEPVELTVPESADTGSDKEADQAVDITKPEPENKSVPALIPPVSLKVNPKIETEPDKRIFGFKDRELENPESESPESELMNDEIEDITDESSEIITIEIVVDDPTHMDTASQSGTLFMFSNPLMDHLPINDPVDHDVGAVDTSIRKPDQIKDPGEAAVPASAVVSTPVVSAPTPVPTQTPVTPVSNPEPILQGALDQSGEEEPLSVTGTPGSRILVLLDEPGWIYLGSGEESLIRLVDRSYRNGMTEFVFSTDKEGEYILRFERQNLGDGTTIQQPVELSVSDRYKIVEQTEVQVEGPENRPDIDDQLIIYHRTTLSEALEEGDLLWLADHLELLVDTYNSGIEEEETLLKAGKLFSESEDHLEEALAIYKTPECDKQRLF